MRVDLRAITGIEAEGEGIGWKLNLSQISPHFLGFLVPSRKEPHVRFQEPVRLAMNPLDSTVQLV